MGLARQRAMGNMAVRRARLFLASPRAKPPAAFDCRQTQFLRNLDRPSRSARPCGHGLPFPNRLDSTLRDRSARSRLELPQLDFQAQSAGSAGKTASEVERAQLGRIACAEPCAF